MDGQIKRKYDRDEELKKTLQRRSFNFKRDNWREGYHLRTDVRSDLSEQPQAHDGDEGEDVELTT